MSDKLNTQVSKSGNFFVTLTVYNQYFLVSVHHHRCCGLLGRRVCDGQRLPAHGSRQAGVQARGG